MELRLNIAVKVLVTKVCSKHQLHNCNYQTNASNLYDQSIPIIGSRGKENASIHEKVSSDALRPIMEKDGKQCTHEDKITKVTNNSNYNERRKIKDKRIHSIDLSSIKKVDSNDSTNAKNYSGLTRRR